MGFIYKHAFPDIQLHKINNGGPKQINIIMIKIQNKKDNYKRKEAEQVRHWSVRLWNKISQRNERIKIVQKDFF